VISYDLVPLLLGKSWEGLELPLIIMSLSGILRVSTENVSPLFLALGRPKANLFCNVISAILFPSLVVGLGLNYGLAGVYMSWFVFLPIAISYSFIVLEKVSGIEILAIFKALIPATISVLVMVIVGYHLSFHVFSEYPDWVSLILVMSGSAVVYTASLLVLMGRGFLKQVVSFGIEK